jgi:transcriptional regulator with XRE-family HTH domain
MAKNPDIAYVSAPVVKWARERAGLSAEELATHLKSVRTPQIIAWENGDSLPTLTQAEKLSEKLRVPLAVLFMENPPDISLPIPDLRTVSDTQLRKPSLEFFDLVCDALIRQRWYREFQERNESAPLPFVGSFQNNHDVNAVAADMAERLGVDAQLRKDCMTWQNLSLANCYFAHDSSRFPVLP